MSKNVLRQLASKKTVAGKEHVGLEHDGAEHSEILMSLFSGGLEGGQGDGGRRGVKMAGSRGTALDTKTQHGGGKHITVYWDNLRIRLCSKLIA